MTAEEIITEIKKLDDVAAFMGGDVYGDEKAALIEKFGPYKQHYRERHNDNVQVVMYFEKHDIYIGGDAYYSSYNGEDWEEQDFYQTKPTEETITVYHKI